MLAVWISNADNDNFGSSVSTNTIMYSKFDGTFWSTPTAVDSGIRTILGTTLAYNGAIGTFVFVVDSDDDLDTTDDQELWYTLFESGAWSTPQQLTNDTQTDVNPKLVYDSLGDLHLAWLKGPDIHFTNNLDVANSTVYTSPGQSMGARDFDLSISNTDNIALVWNDTSATYNDLWMAYYDTGMDSISSSRQLTFDDASERFINTAFDVNDNLVCVYDKNFTQYEDRTETINGQEVTITGVPKSGTSDLTYLSYSMDVDLSVEVENINIDPQMAFPASDVTITTLIKNIGETPVANTEVELYQCDDQDNCTLIYSAIIPEIITGGGEQEINIPWTVPAQTDQATFIRVDVDPTLVFDDHDRSNNSATIPATKSDLTISSIEVQNAGNKRMITFRVSNIGSIRAQAISTKVNRNALDGSEIFSVEIPEILPGAFKDVSFTWSNPVSQDGSFIEIYAIIDETDTIDEFDETNNTVSARVIPKRCGGDIDNDGDTDGIDLYELLLNMDQIDLSLFAKSFGSNDCL